MCLPWEETRSHVCACAASSIIVDTVAWTYIASLYNMILFSLVVWSYVYLLHVSQYYAHYIQGIQSSQCTQYYMCTVCAQYVHTYVQCIVCTLCAYIQYIVCTICTRIQYMVCTVCSVRNNGQHSDIVRLKKV